jgi:hypothetical protein
MAVYVKVRLFPLSVILSRELIPPLRRFNVQGFNARWDPSRSVRTLRLLAQ